MKISDVAKLTGVTVRTLHDEEHSRLYCVYSLPDLQQSLVTLFSFSHYCSDPLVLSFSTSSYP